MLSKISFYFKKDENYHHFLNTCVLGPINIIKKITNQNLKNEKL